MATRLETMKSELAESLMKCKVQGNVVYLPPISDGPLSNYAEVRKALLNAGATYKKNTFVFKSDAQPFIDRLTNGESVNIKKEFQFFPTPDDIADWLVELSGINERDGNGFGSILEPSAGHGAIVKAIHRATGGASVCGYELMPENQDVLKKIKGFRLLGDDFLKADVSGWDHIVANPPFNKNQDIDHITKMWKVLNDGGSLVSIASKHWQLSSNKKEKQFRTFLENLNAEIHEIEAGKFKESGTLVSCCVIVLNK